MTDSNDPSTHVTSSDTRSECSVRSPANAWNGASGNSSAHCGKDAASGLAHRVTQMNIGEQLNVPIVGFEVMEERARFTIYKLKVVDGRTGLSWLVFRRYTDFARLSARLQAERAAAPRLPAKRWLRDNFEPAFLEERARGLQVFVNALVRRLPHHPRVREFLCLDDPPQACAYQPEVQAVYGALEDSIDALKTQLQQKENALEQMRQRIESLEREKALCRCGKDS